MTSLYFKKKFSRFFCGGLIIVLCHGCVSEITLDVPPSEQVNIAIRGSLVAGDEPYVVVKITKVSDFKASEIPEAVSTQRVLLMDEAGNQVEIPASEAGEYYLDLSVNADKMEIVKGRAYRIQITTAAGTTYLSDWDHLLPVPTPTEITQLNEIRDILNESGNEARQEYLRFRVTTPLSAPDSSTGTYLKWSFSGIYQLTETADLPKTCYISEPLNLENVVVFNGSVGRQGDLTDFYLLEEPYDYRFYEDYYLTVRQQSLSEHAFRYWEQVGKVVNRTGSIFEAPAGKVKGNFHNVDDESEVVFGYFYATEETVIRYKVQRGQSDLIHLCSQQSNPPNPFCLNCLAHPRSSLDRPEYWE